MKNISIAALVCPFCGAKHSLALFASYKRHFVTYDNNEVHNNIVTISRYILLVLRTYPRNWSVLNKIDT